MSVKLQGNNDLTEMLLKRLNNSGKLHMVPANVNDYFVIRFCVCAQNATSEDIGEGRIQSILKCKLMDRSIKGSLPSTCIDHNGEKGETSPLIYI